MHRISISSILAISTLLLVSATALAQTDQKKANLSVNLAGSWRQQGDGPHALLKITQVGKKVEAIKEEGDPTYVPLGEVVFKGTFDRNPFTVQWRYAGPNFQDPYWKPVNIEVKDTNTFTSSGDTVWRREPPQ